MLNSCVVAPDNYNIFKLTFMTAENVNNLPSATMYWNISILYQIKGDVDKAMRENHPEMLHSDKTKETETTL